MRVLDLDLDFFLSDCCPLAPVGSRPDILGHEPWDEAALRSFLEQNCGLSRTKKTPGRLYETHDGSLQFWAEALSDGRLKAPFDVDHIDAHSDLGIGRPGPGFVLQNVLSRRPETRADLDQYYRAVQLDEANYLLFALAFRWVRSLKNVRNPRSRPDIPAELSLPEEGVYRTLQLRSAVSALFEGVNGPEPVIPFTVYDDYHTYHADGPFDFVTVARSPRYAPREADVLFEIIRTYIDEI